MNALVFSLRMLLLLLSLYGYLQALRRYCRVEFCFGLCFSMIGSALFLAGMLNLLREAVWAIALGGVFLAGRSLRQKQPVKALLCPGVVFFLGMGVFFLFFLRGSIFLSYDNFSHWGYVAKILTRYDRFPNFSDQNVMFASYPLGSTAFLYFVSEILGNSSEWVLMYAQVMLTVGMLLSLFPFARGWAQSLAVLVCSLFLLCCNNSFFDLLVDTLLPIAALAPMALCLYEGERLREKLWVLLPYSVFLVSIKNSGALFVALLFGCAWLLLPDKKRSFKTLLMLAGVPVATVLLWQKHVSMVFYDGLMSKHSMSARYLYTMLRRKPLDQFWPIIRSMAQKVFQFSNPGLWLLALGLLIYLAARRLDGGKRAGQVLLVAAVSYVCYQLGTLGTYLLSMPLDEALRLASYERYHQSILMFVMALVFLEALITLNALPKTRFAPWLRGGAAALVLVVCYFCVHPNFGYFRKQDTQGSERVAFEAMITDYQVQTDASYVILIRQEREDFGFLEHTLQYLLTPRRYILQRDGDLSGVDLTGINYVIAFEHSPQIDAFLASLGAKSDSVICLSQPEE